jgi:hypothetical protein
METTKLFHYTYMQVYIKISKNLCISFFNMMSIGKLSFNYNVNFLINNKDFKQKIHKKIIVN